MLCLIWELLFFFVASRNMNKLNFDRGILEREIVVSIHLGESIDIEDVCKRCVLSIKGKRMRLNLIPLKIFDFDITLGMDWLSVHRAQMDCFMKALTFIGDNGKKVTF